MTNIHPEFENQLNRRDKQSLLEQKGAAIWLCGLSGSGKSTIANRIEKKLHQEGKFVILLDGDNLRSGINADLGFSQSDRAENIRRTSEIAKIGVANGAIVILSVITPLKQFRELAHQTLGTDYHEIYIKASVETCETRDVKGLYAKQKAGEIKNFTGKGASFEEPESPDLTLDTEAFSIEQSVEQLYGFIKPKIQLTDNET